MTDRDIALQMFQKAVELLRGAQLLHRSHHEHAAYVCSIHAGINAADAIGHHEGDPYRGTDHRAAGQHLRDLDISLAKPAQALRRLADRKSDVEYREMRYTRNQTADAVSDATLLVKTAAAWIGADYETAHTTTISDLPELILRIENDAQRFDIPLNTPPWSTTLAILTTLSDRGATIDQILDTRD